MKKLSILVCLAIIPAFLATRSGYAQNPEESFDPHWVDYREGRISVSFEQTPALVALHVIREKTGVQFHVPPALQSRRLSLRLEQARLEAAVQSLLSSIGFSNFAFMYDEEGRPRLAVVLSGQTPDDEPPADPEGADDRAQVAAQPLTPGERDKLQAELERWDDLKQEERERIEDRLQSLPLSDDRNQLVAEYGQRMLRMRKSAYATPPSRP